jgi:hypothetical protein
MDLATGNLDAAQRSLAALSGGSASAAAAPGTGPGAVVDEPAAAVRAGEGRDAPVAASARAGSGAHPAAMIVDVATAPDMPPPGDTIDVHAVMLALATGNAGSIPASIINLYGPGGALYDPAAIMDAYRNSTLGQAQMAALSWISRTA